MPPPDSTLVPLIRQIVKATLDEANARVRTPAILTGSVEDIDQDTRDVAYIRMDDQAMASDPTQSDNWGEPGVIPTTRYGQAYIGDQVRVSFDPTSGASAQTTSAGPVIVLPEGAEGGNRIVLDLTTGIVSIGDDTTPGARIILDPVGGLRIRSASDILATILDQFGYSLRHTETGVVVAEIKPGSLRLVDEASADDIELVTASGSTMPNPKYTSLVEASPGTSIACPTAPLFTTTPADDYELYHAAAYVAGISQTATWTPPAGTTERVDTFNNDGGHTLAASIAERDPASGGAATFTSSQSNWSTGLGTHVAIRGGGTTSPSFRSKSEASFGPTNATEIALSLAAPPGTADRDILIAFVTMGNAVGTIPLGWDTPEGWVFLGANFVAAGGGPTLQTLAVGAWAKLATASEPATYDLTIRFGAGTKKLHAAIVAIQNPDLVPGGAHIRIAGHPIRRLLAFNELTANSGVICDFQNIPQGFDHLEVIYDGKSASGGSSGQSVIMRFNGDTGTNYHWQRSRDSSPDTALSDTKIMVGGLNGAVAGHRCGARINIFDYTRLEQRMVLGDAFWVQAGDLVEETNRGLWLNTATAINRVRIESLSAAAAQFAAGGRVFLYGY